MEREQVIKNLLKQNDAIEATVKNVTITNMDNYVRISLTLDKSIPSYVYDKNTDDYVKSEHNIMFTSTFALFATLKDNEDAAFTVSYFAEHVEALNVIMSRARVTVVQEEVEANVEYKNPFANENSEATVFDHNTIINHIISIKLNDKAKERIEKIADKMLGL